MSWHWFYILLAIPADGVPVVLVISGKLNLPLDVVVTSMITLLWNSEAELTIVEDKCDESELG